MYTKFRNLLESPRLSIQSIKITFDIEKKTTLVEKEQKKLEVLLLLEQVLIALDQNEMSVPAIKIAEAIDALDSEQTDSTVIYVT